MRSTPARALREGQLLVEGHSVSKINSVQFPLPHNTVTIEVADQITRQQSMRNLRWDELVTTEAPAEIKIGDTGKITIELALLAPEPLYRYKITDEAAGIDHEGVDLRLVQDCQRKTRARPRRF